jgi:hypothetical protein
MKLQKFYILTAAALLIGAVSVQAQSSNLSSTTGPLDNLNHDCVAKEQRGNQVLLLNDGDIATQSFVACEQGVVEKAYVIVKQTSNDGTISAEITDSRGQELEGHKLAIKEGFGGVVSFKLQTKVDAGTVYFLKLKAINTNLVIEGQYGETSDNTLHLNGWKLDGHISTAVGMRHEIERPEANTSDRYPYENNIIEDRATEFQNTFAVYPNPFVDEVNVTFKREFKGQTIVMLTDLSGNVLHREVRMNPLEGQNVKLIPAYNLRPGAYALRILNDNRVYNQTLMKQ